MTGLVSCLQCRKPCAERSGQAVARLNHLYIGWRCFYYLIPRDLALFRPQRVDLSLNLLELCQLSNTQALKSSGLEGQKITGWYSRNCSCVRHPRILLNQALELYFFTICRIRLLLLLSNRQMQVVGALQFLNQPVVKVDISLQHSRINRF